MAVNLSLSVEGAGLQGGNTAEPSSFTITVRDQSGQPVALKGNPLKVEITGPGNRNLNATLQNNNNGTWTVTYQAQDNGQHDVTVHLTTQTRVGIAIGTDASKTKVHGPGIQPEGVQDNLPTHFFIESVGTDGQPVRKGGDPFEVKITGPKGDVPAKITDNGDGTYRVDYAPQDAGPTRIDVTLKNKPVADSPYNINVREGADHTTSFIDAQQFVVRARTKTGKNMTKGGEAFTATVQGPAGPHQVQLADKNDGTYVVSYNLPAAQKGNYAFSVQVTKKDIVGSPFNVSY
jgi:filamin